MNVPLFNSDGSVRKALTVTATQQVPATGGPASCRQSSFGVGPNVYSCGATADNAPDCAGQPGSQDLYCLDDPVDLTARHLRIEQPLTAVAESGGREPYAMTLADGSTCRIRGGGTYDSRPDGWTAAYGCSGDTEYVLYKAGSPLVDQSGATWFVMTGPLVAAVDLKKPVAPPARVDVATAYFVANGAAAAAVSSPSTSTPVDAAQYAVGHGPLRTTAFQSPSGNIACLITDAELTCEMLAVNGIGPADCANGPVQVTAVQGQSPVTVCQNNAEPVRRVLDYGRSLAVSGYTCTSSASAGVQCSEPGNHHMKLTKAHIDLD